MCDITHLYVPWLISHSGPEIVTCVLPNSFICVPRLNHVCDVTHACVWHDSFVRVTWLIYMCDMTHLYVWHDSFICVTWLIQVHAMTPSYVWHDSFMYAMNRPYVPWLISYRMSNIAFVAPRSWHDSIIRVTWRIHLRIMRQF